MWRLYFAELCYGENTESALPSWKGKMGIGIGRFLPSLPRSRYLSRHATRHSFAWRPITAAKETSFCTGKMWFKPLRLGFGHWEWEKCQKSKIEMHSEYCEVGFRKQIAWKRDWYLHHLGTSASINFWHFQYAKNL